MKHLHALIAGMSIVGTVLSSPAKYPKIQNGFARDRVKLQSDANIVVTNFNKNIKEKYKSSYGK